MVALAFAATATGCSAGVSTGGVGLAIPVVPMRPDDRVVLRDMRTVLAIATSFEYARVIYPAAVGTWDSQGEHWDTPITTAIPRALAEAFQAVIDPLDRSVWIATPSAILHFDPLSVRWDYLPTAARVTGLGIDPTNPEGIFLQTTAGWYLQPRIGSAHPAQPSNRLEPAATLKDAYGAIPSLLSEGEILATGPGLRPGRLTAAAPDPATNGWFVGTSAAGLLHFGPALGRPERLLQGPPGNWVGALLAVPGGVWAATDRSIKGEPAAITFMSTDLSQTIPLQGDPVFGLGAAAIHRILPGDRVLWLGTDQGVVRLGIDDGSNQRWGMAEGLPDQRILALAAWQDGIAVGMSRGLAFIGANGQVTRPAAPLIDIVHDLHHVGDTLWIGTGHGLAYLTSATGTISRPSGWASGVGAGVPVLRVGSVGDTLVAMLPDRLAWREPATGRWWLDQPVSAGTLRAIDISSGGVWVGGDDGAMLVAPGTGPIASLGVGDLPGPVLSLTTGGGYLWVGTVAGLVRTRLQR